MCLLAALGVAAAYGQVANTEEDEEPIDLEKSKKFLHDLNAWINYLRNHPVGTRSVDEIVENKIVSSDFFNENYETIEKYCKKF